MNELDLVFKAFKELRKVINQNPSVQAFINELGNTQDYYENLESVSAICKIDGDWIDRISIAVPFLFKAVDEQRQFVRSDGNVLPIEKVRSVSRDSVVDLSKHSNYISHVDDDNKIIPDKLYMARKENDYAVYENRFLYTLLKYLYDFIEIRLNEIIALTGRYESKVVVKKNLHSSSHNVEYNLEMTDIRYNDPVCTKKGSFNAINVLKKSLNDVKLLLMTPLMKEVSNAPEVKAPITKTNIIRFDKNFKEALSLFNYLTSYTGKGFSIEKQHVKISPFKTQLLDDFSQIIYLSSFITYKFANSINDDLKKRYDAILQEEEKAKNERVLFEIKRVQGKIRESGFTTEEYVSLLEKGKNILEGKLKDKEEEVVSIYKKTDAEMLAFESQAREIIRKAKEEFEATLAKTIADDQAKFDSMKSNLEQKLQNQENAYEEKISQMNADFQKQITEMREKHQTEIQSLINEKDSQFNQMKAELENQISEISTSSAQQIATLTEENKTLDFEKQKLSDENDRLSLELTANQFSSGGLDPKKMANKDDFAKLEAQKKIFDKLFNKAWQETKKTIRKEIYAQPNSFEKKDKKRKDKSK